MTTTPNAMSDGASTVPGGAPVAASPERKPSTNSQNGEDEEDFAHFSSFPSNEAQCSHVIFGILKYEMVALIQKVGWEPVKNSFLQQGLEILMCSKFPFKFTKAFWLDHYKNTIAEKERRKAGGAERYTNKIVARLADTPGIPILVAIKGEDNHVLLTPDELRDLKLKTRAAVSDLFYHESTTKKQLLHLSDDNLAAQEEIAVLQAHLASDDAILATNPKDAADVRHYIDFDLLPKLQACESFIGNCANDIDKSCRGLRHYLSQNLGTLSPTTRHGSGVVNGPGMQGLET